jgi:hypothetical protein
MSYATEGYILSEEEEDEDEEDLEAMRLGIEEVCVGSRKENLGTVDSRGATQTIGKAPFEPVVRL